MSWLISCSWATYGFLSLAIISVWFKRTPRIFGACLAIASLLGLLANRLQWPALLFILLFAGLNHWAFKARPGLAKTLCVFMVIIGSILLWLHKIPGFSNWLLLKNIVISQDARPFDFFLNFDKPLTGLFILGFSNICLLKTRSEWFDLLKKTLPMAMLSIVLIIGIACLVGYVRYDLKFNQLFMVFVLNNLLFVSIPEEALCRGLVQTSLSQIFAGYRYGWLLALLLASLFFGMLHQGSALYIMLASFAGLCYGLIYHLTKHIEASILTHFLLNMIHFIGFSYPQLA